VEIHAFIPARILGIIPYAISAALILGLAITAAISAWHRKEVRRFIGILITETAWVIVFILELASVDVEQKIFWNSLRYPLMLAMNAGMILFSYAYVDPSNKGPSSYIKVLLFVPVLIALVAAVAVVLGLEPILYANVDRVPGFPFAEAKYSRSALAVTLYVYAMAMNAGAAAIVLRHSINNEAKRRIGALYIFISFLLPLAGYAFDMAGLNIPSYTGIAPFWFTAGSLICVYGLFSQKLFGSVMTARRAVMDTLLDPVFVLDKSDEVVDCNAAARTLLGAAAGNPIGESARTLFESWPSSVTAALEYSEAETELDLPDKDGMPRRSYRVTVASNPASDRTTDWKLLVFNDISGQKSDARDLAANNEELEFWVRQRTAALRQEVAQRTEAQDRLRELNEEMAKTQKELLWTLSEVVESRSKETAYHVVRVGEYARILAQASGLSIDEVEILTTAAPMHDVGKIAIPDAILGKPGLLTPEEREVMKRHTVVGHEILGSSKRPLLRAAAVIAHEHHERWDGKGYPLGISGTNISMSGRIVAICDVFDALYNKRVYKDAWPLEKVLELFRKDSGTAFEPQLVDIMFSRLDDFLDISRRYADVIDTPVA
jgi:HD-GYP domain-containing protein (c-di-GMP phosphodiesterase class II)